MPRTLPRADVFEGHASATVEAEYGVWRGGGHLAPGPPPPGRRWHARNGVPGRGWAVGSTRARLARGCAVIIVQPNADGFSLYGGEVNLPYTSRRRRVPRGHPRLRRRLRAAVFAGIVLDRKIVGAQGASRQEVVEGHAEALTRALLDRFAQAEAW